MRVVAELTLGRSAVATWRSLRCGRVRKFRTYSAMANCDCIIPHRAFCAGSDGGTTLGIRKILSVGRHTRSLLLASPHHTSAARFQRDADDHARLLQDARASAR